MRESLDGQYKVIEFDNGAVVRQYVGTPTPSAVKPALEIITITSNTPDSTLVDLTVNEVTCSAGSTLTATVELHSPDGPIIPLTAAFRMPVQARDGREVVVLAPFVAGVATIVIPFTQSGVWQITEKAINSALPPEQQMTFSNLTVYVVL